ncbi:MAG: BMP family ABC transporter substrate-binding protein [Candidatus Brockarchaeota archaeon]|nr:BMP family ABC transporter substrate-binding protein [Candidatus Brockarchaeota archaeon]
MVLLIAIFFAVGVAIGYVAGGWGKVPGYEYGMPVKKLKAGFIYVGPVEDFGWTAAHDQARKHVEKLFPWLETVYVESVEEAEAARYIERLVREEGADIVFTTSYGFMDPTIDVAQRYPDKLFFHCSGFKRRPNSGTYFVDFYQVYYLNGLMAGALTKTGKVGYVAAHPIPEVIRHINAFALGVKEANPEAKVYVRWLHEWYAPELAREAAQALVSIGVDTLAFTEDSTAIVEFAQQQYEQGKQLYVFSHYSPMQNVGPDVVVSGQLVHWEVIYADILMKVALNVYNNTNLENVDYLWMLKEGAVELGGKPGVPVNPKFIDELKNKYLPGKSISAYDAVMNRLALMKEANVPFDPFTGPIMDQNGNIKIQAGQRATIEQLFTEQMNWFVDNIIGSPSG